MKTGNRKQINSFLLFSEKTDHSEMGENALNTILPGETLDGSWAGTWLLACQRWRMAFQWRKNWFKCVYMFMCAQEHAETSVFTLFLCSSPYFFETVSHWNWRSPIWLNPLASKPLHSHILCLPSTQIPGSCDYWFTWMLEIQTQILIHASTLPNQSSPQSSCVSFFFSFFFGGGGGRWSFM